MGYVDRGEFIKVSNTYYIEARFENYSTVADRFGETERTSRVNKGNFIPSK